MIRLFLAFVLLATSAAAQDRPAPFTQFIEDVEIFRVDGEGSSLSTGSGLTVVLPLQPGQPDWIQCEPGCGEYALYWSRDFLIYYRVLISNQPIDDVTALTDYGQAAEFGNFDHQGGPVFPLDEEKVLTWQTVYYQGGQSQATYRYRLTMEVSDKTHPLQQAEELWDIKIAWVLPTEGSGSLGSTTFTYDPVIGWWLLMVDDITVGEVTQTKTRTVTQILPPS